MDLDDIADELYGAEPADFVRLRNAYAKQARAEGLSDLAGAVTALRKPTRVGWVLNLFARTQPDDIAALLDLAARLHDAQRSGSAGRLRDLATDRGRVVAQVRDSVIDTADARGVSLSPTAIREIDHTLRAAIADTDVAERLRAGRMVGAVEYSGFGPPTLFAVDDAPVVEEPASGQPHAGDDDVAAASSEDDHRARLAAADEVLRVAVRAADDARDAVAETEKRIRAIESRRDDLRAQIAAADGELRFARRHAETVTSELATAEDAEADARSTRDGLRRR